VAYTIYPYRSGLAEGIGAKSELKLRLAPLELLYVRVVPRGRLKEPVAMGVRWYRQDGSMAVSGAARVLLPGGGVRQAAGGEAGSRAKGELTGVAVRKREKQMEAYNQRQAPGLFRYPLDPDSAEMRALVEKDAREQGRHLTAAVEYELSAQVEVPEGVSEAEVLLLVQFPGRWYRENNCAGELDGGACKLREKNSRQHAGYFVANSRSAWRDLAPYESEWCWYIGQVPAGKHEVRFRGAAGHEAPRLGLWLWTGRELKATPVEGLACPEAELPQVRERLEREGICLRAPQV
jgi:hypothetical protein